LDGLAEIQLVLPSLQPPGSHQPYSQALRYVALMELVAKGQRVKKFKVEISQDGTNFKPVAQNVAQTTIGYKRIIPLNGSTVNSYSAQGMQAKALRITIEDAKACPLLKSVAIY